MAESSSSSSTNGSSSPITRMVQDHLFSILHLLPIQSILYFAMTCKKLKFLSFSDSLWEFIFRRDWGHPPVDALLLKPSKVQTYMEEVVPTGLPLESVHCYRLLCDCSDIQDGNLSIQTPI